MKNLGSRFFTIAGMFGICCAIALAPAAETRAGTPLTLRIGVTGKAHDAQSVAILSQHSKADAGVIAHMQRATYSEKFGIKSMQAVIDSVVRYKGLFKPVDARDLIVAAF